jgi:N-acetylneuraminic acid mutarotase
MLVWGGKVGGQIIGNGAAYDPVADTWTTISAVNAPTARSGHGVVWTGQEMLIFGGETSLGSTSDGAAYDPATDKWRPLSNVGAPLARSGATTVWSGSELLVFAGLDNGQPLASLQRLNPQPNWYLYRKP